MNKDKRPQDLGLNETMLQIRVVRRDHTGKLSDVTQDDNEGRCGWGLKDLQWRAGIVSDELIRINNLLKLLALASEKRSKVDSDVVRHVVEELRVRLEKGSEVGCYVRYTKGLFEEAMPLPTITFPDSEKTGRSLTVLKRVS